MIGGRFRRPNRLPRAREGRMERKMKTLRREIFFARPLDRLLSAARMRPMTHFAPPPRT